MRIRWENIIPVVVIIVLIILMIKLQPLLHSLSNDVDILQDRHSNPVVGILALGLLCVTIVAIVKIISNSRR